MRASRKLLLVTSAAVAATAVAPRAEAQLDINPPLPNVLLLIDTSGSMENMADGKSPESSGATCTPGTTTALNRWATLVSVLTGTINDFSCYAEDRSSSAFLNEFSVGGVKPYDASYYLPFHRILSNGCTAGPGTSLATWYGWPAGAIAYHDYQNASTICPSPGQPGGFSQANDGILDTFRDRVRFGLMTFDSFPNAGTGANGVAPDPSTGMAGMWSYFLGWNSGGSPANGNPPNCQNADFEVGARNPAAPPWEGRLIPFGPYDAPALQIASNNDHIQEALLSMRPYGATPLAGMLADARDFLLNDASTDPATNTPFGPGTDPYFGGGCRKTFIVVLSDGEPNLDLRDACATGNGKCPYPKPYETAHDLATYPDTNKQVKTFAVGFGLSSAAGLDCKTLTASDLTQPGGKCDGATGALRACCTLGRVAYEGGTDNAYYADDVGSLKTALSKVLATIAAGSTSRTLPVFSTASASASAQGDALAASYQFASSFDAPVGGSLWSGNLERKRYECVNVNGTLQAQLQKVTAGLGDDFAENLNANDNAHPRKFFTIIGDTLNGGTVDSEGSVRPNLSLDDGLGLYKGTVSGGGPLDGPTFAKTVTPQAMAIDPVTPPADCPTRIKTASGATCAERTLRWEVGESNAPTLTETRNPLDCPAGETCSKLGAIYHSTPVAVGTPKDYLRDESYASFAVAQAKRPLVLYTATVDGQLHAFKVSANDPADALKVDTIANNELWSFIPPHVLPRILPTYDQQAFLLDGAPVVKDVVYERTQTQAQSANATWNTVLVAAGGAGGSFYYALDVTDPTAPKFLWQLSDDTTGHPLFGTTTSTPAIATIPLLDNGEVKEVAVAILPGGSAPLLPGSCARQQTDFTDVDTTGKYKPRAAVRCWGAAGAASTGPSRSLTIVRLSDGKILMSFRGANTDGPPGLTTNALVVPFDSPITGVPVPYPAQAGQVANRVYVGDSDGTLWRVDLSSPDPTKWTVKMAWDAYGLATDTASSGQPIQTPPVVSVDPLGNNVILFSTGDQEQFTASSGIDTRVWSILDKPNNGKFQTSPNWYLPFTNGKRVTGPISLFNSVAYFATFTPSFQGGLACSDGFGSVWGVDYMQNEGADDKPMKRYAIDPNNPGAGYTDHKDQPAGTVVFGVAVTETPSCSTTTSFNDPYLGNRVAVSDVTGGTFQLVFQTGKGGSGDGTSSKTNTTVEQIPAPTESTRIDSWASVIE